MGKKIKKIVAREGLILISIAVVVVILIVIHEFIPFERPTYFYRCSTDGKTYDVELTELYFEGYIPHKQKALIYHELTKDNPFHDLIENPSFVPDDFEIKFLRTQHTGTGKIRNFVLMLAGIIGLGVYPFRFIKWAIKTVKEK